MKIKSLGYLSFLLSFDHVDVITDPLSLLEAGLKLSKEKSDVVLHTTEVTEEDINSLGQIDPSKKKEVLNITSPGEYELGGLMVRRSIGSNFYILDEDYLRVLYVGNISKDVKVEEFKNLGDVDVLIIPVGDGDKFPEFGVVEKIINMLDPLLLIPSGFKTADMSGDLDLKTADEFVKQAGYTNVQHEKTTSITGAPEKEVRNMDVVILE